MATKVTVFLPIMFLLFLSVVWGEDWFPSFVVEGIGGDGYGPFVTVAGDIDGDGFDDLLVGSLRHRDRLVEVGPVTVYHGGQRLNAPPDVFLSAKVEDLIFGWPTVGAGDVNGDGFDDVLVGASSHIRTGGGEGSVYLYHGSSRMDDVPDLILTTGAWGDGFGRVLAGIGDVNGDGYDDVAVAAPRAGGGKVYVYWGGPEMDDLPDVILEGESKLGRFGNSVDGIGDVNGDGCDDLLVGDPSFRGGYRKVGRAYLYLGSSRMDADPDLVLGGQAPGQIFGWSAAGVGDLNGDGLGDFAVEVKKMGWIRGGKFVFIYLGGTPPDAEPDVQLGGGMMVSLAAVGDVNGDGYADVVTGTFSHPRFDRVGLTNLYWGGEKMDGIPDVTLTRQEVSGWFGRPTGGDVNGDGLADVVLVASRAGHRGTHEVYVYSAADHGISKENASMPSAFSLGHNYPNPFNAMTAIPYALPEGQDVSLKLYNTTGQLVRTLVSELQPPGKHEVVWDGRNDRGREVSSGMYVCRLVAGEFSKTQRLMLVR